MLRNFAKLAFRGLRRHRTFSLINIFGLAIGMGSALLIGLWIAHEWSYDHFYPKQERLFELMTNSHGNGKVNTATPTPEIMAHYIEKDVPEAETVARLSWASSVLFHYGEKDLMARGCGADPGFLSMFDFPMVSGNPATALNDPYSVVLTEHMAKSLFGSDDPIGKLLKVDTTNLKVSGVMKDLPDNTQFQFDWLLSYRFREVRGYVDSDWTNASIPTFILLKPNTSPVSANRHLKGMIVDYSGGKTQTEAFLYPMGRTRLYSSFENGKPTGGGRITTVRIFGIIACLILFIACINFMNLSTARSHLRAREVGVRKVVGSARGALIGQFLGESFLVTLLGGILALVLVQWSLSAFSALTGKALTLPLGSPVFWAGMIVFIGCTGMLAGSYPAFFLSSFKPAAVLKGVFVRIGGMMTPRKVLVVVQFSVAMVLMIGTIVIVRQVRYGQARQKGYAQQNLIYIRMEGGIQAHYEAIRNDLLNSGAVTDLSASGAPLTRTYSVGAHLKWPGSAPDEHILFMRTSTDGNFVKTIGLTLTQGRDIDVRKYPTDSTACLINEAALKAMGVHDPIGLSIFDDPVQYHVVGVVRDFVLGSPYEAIWPMIVKGPINGISFMHLRLNEDRPTDQNLATVARILKVYNPTYPFQYHFLDEDYERNFASERQTGKLAALFAGLAIFLSCLGLFGLATFMAESRVKEIGIRKVLGASVLRVTMLLSGSFAALVGVAILIATPIGWYVAYSWLQEYSYRAPLNAVPFVLAGAGAMVVALATVSIQALKAARTNPVKSLRSE